MHFSWNGSRDRSGAVISFVDISRTGQLKVNDWTTAVWTTAELKFLSWVSHVSFLHWSYAEKTRSKAACILKLTKVISLRALDSN
jgi:hypothetical protein